MTERRASRTHVVPAGALDASRRRELYALYERYYEATSLARFEADLAEKHYVLELRDDGDALCGFSTLALYTRTFEGRSLRVLFSGDTVVDAASRGRQALAFGWVRLAASLKAESPQPLYWLLICKGHRTYRYLPAFSRDFDPTPHKTIAPVRRRLLDFLARDRYGDAYDASLGVVRFARSQGHLRADQARVPAIHAHLPEVEFFLQRNPGFAQGDELVCLCELAAGNLRPMAQRAFAAAELAAALPDADATSGRVVAR